jgi:hypothetical protein
LIAKAQFVLPSATAPYCSGLATKVICLYLVYLLNILLYHGIPLDPLDPLEPTIPLDPTVPLVDGCLEVPIPTLPLVENELVDGCLEVPIPTLPLVVDVPIPIDIK